ncbi:MAG: SGNH/GDSL hydrolase family protein [Burkholderiaceae bacterium]
MHLQRMRFPRVLLLVAGGALLYISGCAAWRIGHSVELAEQSEPFQQTPNDAQLRLLIVGDSTAVGTGATSGRSSLAGLIARQYPRLLVENRARDGAKFADVVRQLGGEERFDIVLVQAGGNDVIRLGTLSPLQADIGRVAELARKRADVVVLMPAGNVGNAPFFFAPVSWLMTQRSRELHRYVREAAAKTGAAYVNLFQERRDDPFVKDRSLNAIDGLHPSDAGYRVWFGELMAQGELGARLAPARAKTN